MKLTDADRKAAVEEAAKDRRGGTWTGERDLFTYEDYERGVEIGFTRGFLAGIEHERKRAEKLLNDLVALMEYDGHDFGRHVSCELLKAIAKYRGGEK